jgi:hypothetical protein
VSGGAPSPLHEARVVELEGVFALAGLAHEAHLQWWLRPDVARASPASWTLALGDAKSTESPGNQATLRRLIAYVRAARAWHDAGWVVLMSLAVNPQESTQWGEELLRAWAVGELVSGPVHLALLHPNLAVVTLSTSRRQHSTNGIISSKVGV